MCHVMIVGGGLQGVEAVYLAKKADWQVTLVDRNENCPASGMCDSFIHTDVTIQDPLSFAADNIQLVIPALEDDAALAALESGTLKHTVPFAFDRKAYEISSSKVKSNRLFSHLNIPIPEPWPKAKYPLIVKPSRSSGSRGVRILATPIDMDDGMPLLIESERIVMEEFLRGPSYSLEIMGCSGHYLPIQVTELLMDEAFDCKCVMAPVDLSETIIDHFNEMAINIASSLSLTGIMDVEVILHKEELKVLEIDARLPSQTPTAVYWSSGTNMLCLLRDIFLLGKLIDDEPIQAVKSVVYQHIHIRPGFLEVAGEHLMNHVGPLTIKKSFFGADEAITNYRDGVNEWVATLIISETNKMSALAKKDAILADIRNRFSLGLYSDRIHDLLR